MTPLNFGQALEALKQGKCVSRMEWVDNDLYLHMQRGSQPLGDEQAMTAKYIHSFAANLFDIGDEGSALRLPSLNMTIGLGPTIPGWQLLPTDVLAEDWYIYEPPRVRGRKATKEEELP